MKKRLLLLPALILNSTSLFSVDGKTSNFYSFLFVYEKTRVGIEDIITLLSMLIFISIILLFRQRINAIIKNSVMRFINNYIFIIFPLITIFLFILGISGFNNIYKYIYRSLFLSLLTLYLSIFLTTYFNKAFLNFDKTDKEKKDSSNDKNIHFVNIFISSFLKLFINIIIIIVIFLIWTIPFDILNNIFKQLNITPLEITKTLIEKSIHLFFIFLIGGLVIYISKIIGNNIYRLVEDENPNELNEKEARAKTLINVTQNIIKVIVFIFILFSFLQEIGINIATLLAGAGIVGIAIGFGAQSLVKDFFSGFFILVENQYAVGDVIKIGDISGSVEKITLRITVLRNLEGILHIIPNGNISTVSNMTHGWSRAVLDIGVSYKENIQRVFNTLDIIINEIFFDQKWNSFLISKPEIIGVDKLGEYSVVIRIIAMTKPGKQWEITRELNKRIKNKFDEEGIEIPYPHVKIISDSLEKAKRGE